MSKTYGMSWDWLKKQTQKGGLLTREELKTYVGSKVRALVGSAQTHCRTSGTNQTLGPHGVGLQGGGRERGMGETGRHWRVSRERIQEVRRHGVTLWGPERFLARV